MLEWIGTLLILWAALKYTGSTEYYGLSGDYLLFYVKLLGAAVGSSIAVVFHPGGDKAWQLTSRFIIGTILGFIFAPVARSQLGWEETFDYWLAAATLCGLTAVLFLYILFSKEFRDSARDKVRRMVK